MGDSPTIRDVAVAADVAIGTVSRVLNGHKSVSDDVRRRVLKAIKKLKGGMMPPPGAKQPDRAAALGFASWLETSLDAAAAAYSADGVLGPVDPLVPAEAPAWIRRGRFYDFPRMASGEVVPPNRLRFGNVLLRGRLLRELEVCFDPAYGLTGGEDGDLLSRLALAGARIVWCDEAIVREPIEQSRLSLAWLLRRSLRGGQDFARHSLSGRYGTQGTGRMRLLVRALLQLIAAATLSVLALPLGRHRAAHWLTKASANLGKLSVFMGWHYREYA